MKRRQKSFLTGAGMMSAYSSLLAIAVGLLFGFVILLISNPSQAVSGLGMILKGGFTGGRRGVGQVLYYATPIIMTGLSVGFAFKTGLFNIGAPGQLMVGGFVAIYVGIKWTFLPGISHWVCGILMGMLAGGLWALIPGLFKALLNVNEVISSIMMNYIGMYGVNLLIEGNIHDKMKNQTLSVAENAVIPRWGLDKIFVNQMGDYADISTVNIGIIIAILLAIAVYIILYRTKFGFELRACGLNRHASRYAGINEKRMIASSMVIAGMLAGCAGALMYLAPASGLHMSVEEILSPEGFNGISVALLGMSHPIGIIFAGLFIAHISQGGFYLQKLQYMPEIIDIIIAAIIYFSAFALLFKRMMNKWMLAKNSRKENGGKNNG